MSLTLLASALALSASTPVVCPREIVVLGAGQDAGAPQIGHFDDDGPRLLPSSLGVIDRESGERYVFDMSPAITEQYKILNDAESSFADHGVDGVFLTHAHMGHYLGLAWLGREADNTANARVFAMPRMAAFLRENGPWSQLVELGNIAITEMAEGSFTVLTDNFGVLPIIVPHRDEYSETVGYLIMTPDKRAIYMPDLDSWDAFEEQSGQSLGNLITGADYVFVDATFWDDNELLDESGEGRDMSEIPHPRVTETMDRLQDLSPEQRAKVHFIHYNHTNPIRDPENEQSKEVEARGFNIARRGMRICLSGD